MRLLSILLLAVLLACQSSPPPEASPEAAPPAVPVEVTAEPPTLSPEEAEKAIEMGIKLFDQGATKGALRNIEEGLASLPDHFEGRFFQARALDKLGRTDEAIELYRALVDQEPEQAELQWHYGNALLLSDQLEAAREAFTLAQELGYGPVAILSRGAVNMKAKDYTRAIQDYTLVITAEPSMAQAYYQRGRAYQKIQQTEKAQADFLKARRLNSVSSPGWATSSDVGDKEASADEGSDRSQ